MFESNALGVDLSHWNSDIDFPALAKVVDFVILKAGGTDGGEIYTDSTFPARVQAAYDAGLAVGAYWFVGPSYWLQRQQTLAGVENLTDEQHPILQKMLATLKNKAVGWLAFDVEEASVRMAPGYAGTVTDTWLAFYIRDLVERLQRQMRKGNLRQMQLGVYSRDSWFKTYPALVTYMGAQPSLFVWTANWVANGRTSTLAKTTRPNHQPIPFGWSASRAKPWMFFQFAGDSGDAYFHSSVNKGTKELDVNIYNGTPAELRAWAGIQTPQPPAPPPVEPPPPVTSTLEARVAALEAWARNIGFK